MKKMLHRFAAAMVLLIAIIVGVLMILPLTLLWILFDVELFSEYALITLIAIGEILDYGEEQDGYMPKVPVIN